MRLPTRLDLGLACLQVRQVTVKEMRIAAECEDDDGTPDGLWDAEGETIFLLKAMTNEKKRHVFFHEVIHAINDSSYWARYG